MLATSAYTFVRTLVHMHNCVSIIRGNFGSSIVHSSDRRESRRLSSCTSCEDLFMHVQYGVVFIRYKQSCGL